MIRPEQISLYRLILSLTEAMDFVCPEIADHQHRVTFLALNLAQEMGFSKNDQEQLFLAAALHDVGLIRVEDRKRFLSGGNLENLNWHGEMGYLLLRSSEVFARAAGIVRHHHLDWGDGLGSEWNGRTVPLASHVIHLADAVERSIDKQKHILEQSANIVRAVSQARGMRFHPGCVDALAKVAQTEAFWMDLVSRRIYSHLLEVIEASTVDASDRNILHTAEIFARLVDAMSRWTATHSAGVATSAVAMAKRFRFSPRELSHMRTAGLLHDIGKLSVPSEILDSAGIPDARQRAYLRGHTYHTYRILESAGFPREIVEWAAFHHERIDGRGYPFHLVGNELTLGARIMAVADVYTALAEDRPYRSGFEVEEALALLNRMVRDGALDGEVVAVLERDYEEIDRARLEEQTRYGKQQSKLVPALKTVSP
ncbi:MAG: HD-GYP domain-containing protein [Planctomycetota bacterium]|jgi:putative nucleotidyltransferase with HDIG domain